MGAKSVPSPSPNGWIPRGESGNGAPLTSLCRRGLLFVHKHRYWFALLTFETGAHQWCTCLFHDHIDSFQKLFFYPPSFYFCTALCATVGHWTFFVVIYITIANCPRKVDYYIKVEQDKNSHVPSSIIAGHCDVSEYLVTCVRQSHPGTWFAHMNGCMC
jgi:hypothetical protein